LTTRLRVSSHLIAAALTTLTGAAAVTDTGPRFIGKTGDLRRFKLTQALKFQDQDLNVSADVNEKVVRVDDAGLVTVQYVTLNIKAKLGAQDLPVKDSPPLTAVYRPDGALSELRGENASPTQYRLETLTSVKLPLFALAADKTWTWDISPNVKLGIQKSSITYKVLGEETVAGVAAWKVSRAIKELEGDRPASSDGTVWIGKLDGMPIKQVDTWVNAPIPGAPFTVSGTFTLELQPSGSTTSAGQGA